MKELREYIRKMAAEQVALKTKRKTGPYTLERDKWGYVDYTKVPAKVKASWGAWQAGQRNKFYITMALNFYHEIRGSSYRHSTSGYYDSACEQELQNLREQFLSGLPMEGPGMGAGSIPEGL